MTYISHKYKIIFIHIPKCAGSSVRLELEKNDPNLIILQHTSYITLLKEYPFETKNYLIFTIVRNIYDLIVSHYHYVKQNLHFPCFNNDTIISVFNKPFNEYIKSKEFETLRPRQFFWIKDTDNKIPRNINIFYFDTNFQEEINKLFLKNNINLILNIPNYNTSKHENYKNYYNNELLEYVKMYNKEEIEYFNW
jgi:hypothetical protein